MGRTHWNHFYWPWIIQILYSIIPLYNLTTEVRTYPYSPVIDSHKEVKFDSNENVTRSIKKARGFPSFYSAVNFIHIYKRTNQYYCSTRVYVVRLYCMECQYVPSDHRYSNNQYSLYYTVIYVYITNHTYCSHINEPQLSPESFIFRTSSDGRGTE